MRVLMIGTARDGHEKLFQLGHTLVLFMKRHEFANKKHIADDDLSRPYEGIHLFPAGATISEYVSLAQALHEHRPFDAVCSLACGMLPMAIAIAQKLGLPFPVASQALALAVDKHATRSALRAAGLDNTAYRLAHSESDVATCAADIGFPVIVKPYNGAGSSGVSRIDSAADIPLAMDVLAQAKASFPVLVEEFLTGQEFSVEAISERGVHAILAVTWKYTDGRFVECGHIVPAPVPEHDYAAISAFVQALLTAIGIKDGPSHTELILTADGPRLVETHTRPGGDQIFELVHLATGNDLMELTVRQFVGEEVLPHIAPAPVPPRYAAIWYASCAGHPGTRLLAVHGQHQAATREGVHRIKILLDEGDPVGQPSNSYQRLAYAIATGDSPEQALARARQATEQIEFITSEIAADAA